MGASILLSVHGIKIQWSTSLAIPPKPGAHRHCYAQNASLISGAFGRCGPQATKLGSSCNQLFSSARSSLCSKQAKNVVIIRRFSRRRSGLMTIQWLVEGAWAGALVQSRPAGRSLKRDHVWATVRDVPGAGPTNNTTLSPANRPPAFTWTLFQHL